MPDKDYGLGNLVPPLILPVAGESRAERSSELWLTIWTAGGLCWLCVTVIGILWAWPISGTLQGGEYIVRSGGRLLHHAILFLLAAPIYHFGLGFGWPDSLKARTRVVVINILLALLVVRLTPIVFVLSTVVVDGRWGDLSENLHLWAPLHATGSQWLLLLRFWMPTYVLGLVVVALVHTSRRSHRDSVRLAALATQLANARMAALSARLHPHFLFNSLHAIAGLIVDKPQQAVEMVARLGDFLRIALDGIKRPWTTIAEEMAGVEAYLAVQQSRFHDRLRVTMSVDPQVLKARIPALLMQPVVENAIEHGLAKPGDTLAVAVTISPIVDRIHILITNSTPTIPQPLAPELFGDGLRNVAARLQTAFAGAAKMSIGPDHDGGTRAELVMPLNFDGDSDVQISVN
jgi:hypothetical protein